MFPRFVSAFSLNSLMCQTVVVKSLVHHVYSGTELVELATCNQLKQC